jgi:hypothetical protein
MAGIAMTCDQLAHTLFNTYANLLSQTRYYTAFFIFTRKLWGQCPHN